MMVDVLGPRWRGLAVMLVALALVPSGRAAGAGAGDAGAGKTAPAVPAAVPAAVPPSAPAGDAGAGAAAAGPASDAATAKRLAALRKKVLKDDDFVENDELNRDPFHSYVRLFVDRGTVKSRKVPGIFDKVGLEELVLIAIITGDDTPRAMFRDASGYGQSVKKGDFLSRASARVTKILSDRVIVELNEQTGTGETRVVEKAILVNPDEAQ